MMTRRQARNAIVLEMVDFNPSAVYLTAGDCKLRRSTRRHTFEMTQPGDGDHIRVT